MGDLGLNNTEKKAVDAFRKVGGYLYLDAYLQLVQAKAIWRGKGLKLNKGRKLKDPETKVFADFLHEEGRLAETTTEGITGLKFAWLLPKERERERGAWDLGAFFYYSGEHKMGWVRPLSRVV